MGHQKQVSALTWRPAPWTDEALEGLAPVMQHDTSGGLCTLEEICADALLFEAALGADIVGRYALRVDQYQAGAEAWICAAAGNAPGVDLTARGIADAQARLEHSGCMTLAMQTRRRALVKKLAGLGFTLDAFVMRKRLKRAH